MSSQATSTSAERLFGDLGRMEGGTYQSMLTITVEMKELIHMYVDMRLKDTFSPRTDLLQPQGAAFKRTVKEVADIVLESNNKT